MGAGGMDGVASDASSGWGKHPSSLGHSLADSNGSSLSSGSSLWDGTRAQPEQQAPTGLGPVSAMGGESRAVAGLRADRWQQVQGAVEMLLCPVPFPKLLRCATTSFPPNICLQSPSLPARGCAGAAWAARLCSPHACRRKRLRVWGVLGPGKPLLGWRRMGDAQMRKRQSSCPGAAAAVPAGVQAGLQAEVQAGVQLTGADRGKQSPPWSTVCLPRRGSMCPVPQCRLHL